MRRRPRPPYKTEKLTETEETENGSGSPGEDTTSEYRAASEEVIKQERLSDGDKWASFNTRLLWTLVLIFSFFGILAAGHFYCGVLVMLIMAGSYREIINLKRNQQKEKSLPLFFVQRWYGFAVTVFGMLYGYLIPFAQVFVKDPPYWMYWVSRNHTIVTYMAVLLGVMVFILSLRRYSIKYQFTQLSILVLSCLVVVCQGATWIKSISEGLIWFIVPSTAVIANDISAYLCGKKWGKTKLIPRISPKKTVEGFIGASVVTFAWALILTELLTYLKVATCPAQELTMKPFAMWWNLDCETPNVFRWTTAVTPEWMRHMGVASSITYKPVWIDSMILSAFASFCAPFGGFLASAFKRALKVKGAEIQRVIHLLLDTDFGDYIPGHGGVTDRFDCQLLMGTFTFIYLRTFVLAKKGIPVLSAVKRMTQLERIEFFGTLASELRVMLSPPDYAAVADAFCQKTRLPPDAFAQLLTD
eukprot:Gregarina_sp_Poly_1__10841@NODE_83_length_15529_cov_95_045531_g71_i0_p5_GENE_NODE_83_length_15529_cov_95_045531_g71_i0NODE_83_length_15529_cov_95_045531_g71_i0_p5_ORF_typecomplete_len473_score63_71CTP_transf_1/PF01148_20/1e66CarSlike/PF01864_17/1_6e03CarSlike/PF01864_17/0_5CarSlike/PF01864_17/2_5DUF4231/PF14015_6/6_5e02DUF4231/PF14015_6/1_4DUF4231/PF14015_6/6_5e03_NODE_83_length_15529_cov_95_045531_g71_i01352114939